MPISELKSKNVPIKLWTPIHEVESQALDQLKNIGSLPWVFHHVAVMPDVHLGKGATVGSVIAMKNAVSPAAVGVDIGCTDGESEFLSPTGWVKIKNWDNHLVMQYDPNSGFGNFVLPNKYIKKTVDKFYHIKTKYGVDQVLSPDHKIFFYKHTKDNKYTKYDICTAQDIYENHKKNKLGWRGRFLTSFQYIKEDINNRVNISDEQLRVMVMVLADGYFPKRNKDNNKQCIVKVKKERKYNRIIELLTYAQIQYSYKQDKYGCHIFSFIAPLKTKTFNDFWNCSEKQLKIICDEVFHWDGNLKSKCYYTRDKLSADFIQYAFSASGKRARLLIDKRKNGELDYRVFCFDNIKIGISGSPKSEIIEFNNHDGCQYCFNLPTGFWVMRRNGCVVITGNCGMAAVKTNLTANDLPESLKDIRNQIERDIPVGFEQHKQVHCVSPKVMKLFSEFENLHSGVQQLFNKASLQLGSLGGGNHFIELCLDTEQNVWMMLHSGSRNIGKSLAEIHISKAKELSHNQDLPDKDLAVFLAGTPEMEAYRHDLFWAQKYAFWNRQTMLDLYYKALKRFFPQLKNQFQVICHHNYVSEETHFGENVVVTRKGAISAQKDEWGIIPGSMGAKSFIVQGKGNSESFCSASHGAGRKMSRSQARKKYNFTDLINQTQGVECRKDDGVVDEIPAAYKDIEAVMKNQEDLVEIKYELKQILCIKG